MTWDTGAIFGELKAEKWYTISESGAGEKADLSSDRSVQSSVSGVKADLRTMATALEAYFIDFNHYPVRPSSLTTPISYLVKVPVDPFDKNLGFLRLIVNDKGKDWKAYSVGPDQLDNEGAVVYDPTNGTISAGDIVRVKQ